MSERLDFDWLVIGSGFGGSVAALRLAEKGYRVGVLECGRRFGDEDFAKSAWQLRRYFWMPRIGLRGIFRLTVFKDVFIASGNGVGGGSLGYANTLYRAQPAFFSDPQWDGLAEWDAELRPHYETAERMLGVADFEGTTPADALLRSYGEEIGVGDTFKHTRVGIFFGPAGEQVADPYFGGEGPARTGCVRCAGCMIGCRYGAKNTLVKNYLWFAEKLGAEIIPERQVTEIRPLGADADGSHGYVVTTEHPGAWLRKRERAFTAGGVVVAAGALGTNQLLANCKHGGALPRISDRLGHLVRTNSESIQAVTALGGEPRLLQVGRDLLQHLSRSRYPHRGRLLRSKRRCDQPPVHGDDRRRHPGHTPDQVARGDAAPSAEDRAAAAVALRLVATDDHPAGDAVARHGDAARPEAKAVRSRRAPADRAGPRPPQPDLHPRGRARRDSGSPSRPAASPRAASPSRLSTSRPPPTSSAAP